MFSIEEAKEMIERKQKEVCSKCKNDCYILYIINIDFPVREGGCEVLDEGGVPAEQVDQGEDEGGEPEQGVHNRDDWADGPVD